MDVVAWLIKNFAGAQVADLAGAQGANAAVADAHPASAVRVQASRFGLLQQRATIIDDVNAAVRERDPPTRWLRGQIERRRHEALRVHVLAVLTDGLDQSGWTTDEDRVRFRHGHRQVAGAESAVEIAAAPSTSAHRLQLKSESSVLDE